MKNLQTKLRKQKQIKHQTKQKEANKQTHESRREYFVGVAWI